jgi:glyoxylase-like metal-dependent hydrolase (beta-lactamase superfamily II)
MRVVAVHEDAIVAISQAWQTTATAVRAGDEALLVDSPVWPDELDALPRVLEGAGFEVSGLLATHGDFDHLLGRLAYPGHALGVAESTALRLRAEPGAAQRELRELDERFYVERPRPLALGSWQAVPVPGKLELGSDGVELELHPAEGHTADGMAIFAPHAGVLCAGDYLSPVELPTLGEGSSLADYRATLARLAAVVERCTTVVPGHGAPLARADALGTLDDDLAYLDALERGEERPALPPGRDGARMRALHAENIARLG